MTNNKIENIKQKSTRQIKYYDDINWGSLTLTGGKTGSARVTLDDEYYQYKPPIDENNWIRKVKSNYLDSENFGELLASRIVKAFDSAPPEERVPNLHFVINKNNSVSILSKYLTGTSVNSLDQHLQPGLDLQGKHIKLVSQSDLDKKGHVYINKDLNLKKELARAIAYSAFVGDHDVNPGNMIVIKNEKGEIRVGRIDYGHAFNDLLRYPAFGGQKVHDNSIIDFFNRSTLDGPNKPKTKLWRDYPGLTPSRELAEALKELSRQDNSEQKIVDAIDSVKQELSEIFKNKEINQSHIIQSFQRIAEQVSGKPIDSKLDNNEKMKQIFDQIQEYAVSNIKKMSYASDVMMLQVEIKEALEQKYDAKLSKLKEQYDALVANKEKGPFSWFKENATQPPFKGNFQEFVEHQKKAIAIEQIAGELSKHIRSDDSFVSSECRKLLAVTINNKLSVEDQFTFLENKLADLEKNPTPKPTLLQTVINFCNALIQITRIHSKPKLEVSDHVTQPKDTFKLLKEKFQAARNGNTETKTLNSDEPLKAPNEVHGVETVNKFN